MHRMLAFVLVLSFGHASTALAEDSLLATATRIVLKTTARTAGSPRAAGRATTAIAAAEQQSGLAAHGMSKRSKILIAVAAGAGFALSAYAIDHKVLDNTPSSLGTRKD